MKRGDIGSTTQALRRRLPRPGLAAGRRRDHGQPVPRLRLARSPMIETARKHDAGVFVLALTSNKEGPEVQHATGPDGGTVAGAVLDRAARGSTTAPSPLGSFGAVVGATIGDTDEDARHQRAAARARVRRPGRHAGRHPADLRGRGRAHVLASSSREMLAARTRPGRAARRRSAAPTTSCRRSPDEAACLDAARRAGGRGCWPAAGAPPRTRRTTATRSKDHQDELTEIVAEGGPDALLARCPSTASSQDEAPRDITDEWQQLVDAARRPRARPWTTPASTRATYDPKNPPPDLERRRGGRDRRRRDRAGLGGDASARSRASSSRRSTCARPR